MGKGGVCPTLIPKGEGGSLKAESYSFGRYGYVFAGHAFSMLSFHLSFFFADIFFSSFSLPFSPFFLGRCNPPYRLQRSLLTHLKAQDPDPKFIVITGDIAPHGMPDDQKRITANTTLSDMCQTKLHVLRTLVRDFKKAFPNTKWVYTMVLIAQTQHL